MARLAPRRRSGARAVPERRRGAKVAGHDVRSVLRSGQTDADLAAFLAVVWQGRSDRYSELRTLETAARPKVEMSYIGG